MTNKKITAKFENVDMAEFAAHGIKNNFKNISNIKIRYKNLPNQNREHSEFDGGRITTPLFPVAAAVNTGSFTGTPIYPVYPAYALDILSDNEHHSDIPEIERSTESRIIVEASENEAKQVASKLRCLGGYEIDVF